MNEPLPQPSDIISAGPEGLSHERSLQLGILAALSTRIEKIGTADPKAWLEARGWKVNIWNIENNQGFVLTSDEAIVVAFGGSNSAGDWWKNSKAFFPRDHLIGGKIHRGFSEVLLQGIEEALQLPAAADRPLYITGHSLGGAVATGYFAHLLSTLHPWAGRAFITTYGAPRLGNKAFEAAYETKVTGRHWFYANSKDPVTKLPTNFMGYRHVGKLFYFTKENNLTTPPPDSVGLQNAAPADLTEDEEARLAWLAEEEAMPDVTTQPEFEELVAEVYTDVEAVPDRISFGSDGSLEIAPPGPELQGLGSWIGARHAMELYIENIKASL